MTSPVTSGLWTRTIAPRWKPIQILASGVGCTTTIPNYPRAEATARTRRRQRAPPPRPNHCFFFVSSLALTVTIVPKIWSKPRPTRSSAQPVRANCVKGLASRCDLRVVLSSRECAMTPSTRPRPLDGVEGASSTPPRRGPPVDCRTVATGRPPCRRRWIYLLLWGLWAARVAGRPPALLPLSRAPTAEWHVLARRALVPSVSAPVVATG